MHHRRHQEDDEQPHKMTEEYETGADSDSPYQALEDGDDFPSHTQIHTEERRGLIRHTASSSSSSTSSSSSSSSDWSLAGDAREMRQSLISNAVFFLGSGIQTITGIYDLISVYDDDFGDDDDDTNGGDKAIPSANDDDDEAGDSDWTRQDYILYVLGILGAGMYVLNAISDFIQAKASERSGQGRFGSIPKYEMWAAQTFGLAAVLETITSIFWTGNTPSPLLANVYVVAMHIYFVSGALTLKAQGMSCSYSCRNALSCSCFDSSRAIAKLLMELGGIFFLAGSTVDVAVSYLYDPAIANIGPKVLAAANLSSSILWFVDALLYIAADCIIYSLFRYPIRYFACCAQRNVELPRIITQGDDNSSSKLHI